MEYQIRYLKPFGVMIEALQKDLMIEELNLKLVSKYFHDQQLVILRGFKTFKNAEEFSNYCERWGKISIWPFGKVLELIPKKNPTDHIFDTSYVPLHWDGMYRPQIPEYQIFHCVSSPEIGTGGNTTFSNTILALKYTPDKTKDVWSKVIGIYERKMEFYNSKTTSPIIVKHPYKDFSVIRFNEPHTHGRGEMVNIPKIHFSGPEEINLEIVLHDIINRLYHPLNFYSHEWQNGDVLIADNFSLLHGREKFEASSSRHLQRVQVLSNPLYNNTGLESFQ